MLARNYSIDNLKILCALLIVFLHTGFEFHNQILPVTRCAVPCFFMISGYLLFNGRSVGEERLKRGIRHILGIMIWATVLYAVCKETDSALDGTYYLPSWTDLLNFVSSMRTPSVIIYGIWALIFTCCLLPCWQTGIQSGNICFTPFPFCCRAI